MVLIFQWYVYIGIIGHWAIGNCTLSGVRQKTEHFCVELYQKVQKLILYRDFTSKYLLVLHITRLSMTEKNVIKSKNNILKIGVK